MLSILFQNLEIKDKNELIEELNKIKCEIVYILIKNIDDIIKVRCIPINDNSFKLKNENVVNLIKKISSILFGLLNLFNNKHECNNNNCEKNIINLKIILNNLNIKLKNKLESNNFNNNEYLYVKEILNYLHDFKIDVNVLV